MWKVRNFHQGFERGFIAGVLHAGLQLITNGRGIRNRYPNVAGYTRLQRGAVSRSERMAFDGKFTFDRLTDVYNSGTAHDEDQPVLGAVRREGCRKTQERRGKMQETVQDNAPRASPVAAT